MNSNEALEYLMSFKGIGTKVASCILLFAYQKFDVYPIDTWVKKYMLEDYNIVGEKNIKEFTSNKYKEYSGLAIQYMFNYKRNKKWFTNNKIFAIIIALSKEEEEYGLITFKRVNTWWKLISIEPEETLELYVNCVKVIKHKLRWYHDIDSSLYKGLIYFFMKGRFYD